MIYGPHGPYVPPYDNPPPSKPFYGDWCTFPSCSCNITCPGVPEPRNFPVFIALGGFFGIVVALSVVSAWLYGVLPWQE